MTKTTKILLFVLLHIFICENIYAQNGNNLHANKDAIVEVGNARFTILTSGLFRMEWSPSKVYDDRASFVVVNRYLPVPRFKKKEENGWLKIETEKAELSYKINSGKFNSENLQIRFINADTLLWQPGKQQQYNLLGTLRTLDNADGDINPHNGKKFELEEGLLSRDGWFFLNDSSSLRFDNSEWPWVTNKTEKSQDWYFIAYGNDYKSALYDFSLIAGKTPMIPRYAFGYWWSRYWSYSDNEFRDLISKFKRFDIPLDVLVVDMDWHTKGWTGWTFNKSLFPDPAGFFKWTDQMHLKTTLNLHPADGVNSSEEQYNDFAKSLNFDTAGNKPVPFMVSDKKYMTSLFNTILRPMEKMGVDFWWLDWQQWPYDKKIPNLNNTWYLNYVFYTEMEKSRPTRPMLYHRWGGLGNHRYQIGFSGDTFISWESLAYQPYVTNTASNVLYSYWSHDIGGHQLKKGDTDVDPELYTRWLQYGALSPIMRTHSTKMGDIKKEIWNYKEPYFDALYNAIKLRYQLVPYIYTMSKTAYDKAIGICRPMYYDYPENELAYTFNKQYMFGDDLLISPIGSKSVNGYSKIKVWLPEDSDWYEWNTGTLLRGGQTYERLFAIDEYPIYVKAGSVIPMYSNNVTNLDTTPEELTICIFPGGSGKFSLYEDNGNDKEFKTQYAITKINSVKGEQKTTVTIGGNEGSYTDMPKQRRYNLKLFGSKVPVQVSVNGKVLSFDQMHNINGWNYEGNNLCVNINLPAQKASERTEVEIRYRNFENLNILDGTVGRFKRLHEITKELKKLDNGIYLPEELGTLEETNRAIEYFPEQFDRLIKNFQKNYNNLPNVINQIKSIDQNERANLINKLHVNENKY